MSSRHFVAAAGLLMLAACETPDHVSGSFDRNFGEALKYDKAVQTINPDPVYPADAAQPGDSGAKGAAAIKRYRTDAVKLPQVESTSSGGAGAGPR